MVNFSVKLDHCVIIDLSPITNPPIKLKTSSCFILGVLLVFCLSVPAFAAGIHEFDRPVPPVGQGDIHGETRTVEEEPVEEPHYAFMADNPLSQVENIDSPSTATPIRIVTDTLSPTETPLTKQTTTSASGQPANPTIESNSSNRQLIPISRTVRIGLHGRNDSQFGEIDYQIIQDAKIETLKMMSLTSPEVFSRIRQTHPDIEFIVRLYDSRINVDGHPTPEEFVEQAIPIMEKLRRKLGIRR